MLRVSAKRPTLRRPCALKPVVAVLVAVLDVGE
jgi:hypothetical protein